MKAWKSIWRIIVPIEEIELFKRWADYFGFDYYVAGTANYELFKNGYTEVVLFASFKKPKQFEDKEEVK